jgi:N-acetylglutamate synthase-like GNAT family acetyltransferase
MYILPIRIRSATEQDQPAITTLVHNERLNPYDLDWRRFVVATDHGGVVGAVQLRNHFDGSRELGSLVVRKEARRYGIASRLIDALLSTETVRVFMITGAAFAAHYERWGFRPIEPVDAPSPIWRNYGLGRLGGILSFLAGCRPNRLAILDRSARVASPRLWGTPENLVEAEAILVARRRCMGIAPERSDAPEATYARYQSSNVR